MGFCVVQAKRQLLLPVEHLVADFFSLVLRTFSVGRGCLVGSSAHRFRSPMGAAAPFDFKHVRLGASVSLLLVHSLVHHLPFLALASVTSVAVSRSSPRRRRRTR